MLSFMLPHAGPVWGNMMEELWALNSIFSHYFLIELKRPSLNSLITLLKRSHEYARIGERSRDFAISHPVRT